MKIDYNKIKAGDRVQIADGAWFTVERWCVNPDDLAIRTYCGQVCLAYAQRLITNHKPAEAKTEAEGLTNPTPAHEPQPADVWTVHQDEQGAYQVYHNGELIESGVSSKPPTPEEYAEMLNDYGKIAEHFGLNDYATQPVGEWFTLDMMSELCDPKYGHGKMLVNLVKGDFDRVLTKHYGHPPIVRTYNGEPASEWGLEEDDFVLWWHVFNYWTTCRYSGLAKGDRWLPMPPAPKPTTEE